jgi:hypothetical protein
VSPRDTGVTWAGRSPSLYTGRVAEKRERTGAEARVRSATERSIARPASSRASKALGPCRDSTFVADATTFVGRNKGCKQIFLQVVACQASSRFEAARSMVTRDVG